MTTKRTSFALSAAFVALALSAGIALAASDDHADHHASSPHVAVAADTAMSQGVIKKIDAPAGKLTIQHGPLRNLDMPPMTMVFRVKNSAWLDQYKPGDAIRFVAEDINGALTVTAIEHR